MKVQLNKIFLVLLLWLVSFSCQATNYALLVGVGDYQHLRDLQGPTNDVFGIQIVLEKKLGFSSEYPYMKVLTDSQANKANILKNLERIAQTAKPGDQVVFYFSGHGTSSGDVVSKKVLNLPHGTGALMPVDALKTGSPRQLRNSLIIGKYDLRPHFKMLDDKGVFTTAIIDACFSSNSTRSIGAQSGTHPVKKLPDRFVKQNVLSVSSGGTLPDRQGLLESDDEAGEMSDDQGNPAVGKKEYPYTHVYTLAASSHNERAKDIPEALLRSFPTYDGKPHGAFTDALLRVMNWQSESDIGSIKLITINEMLRNFVAERGYGHTPQLWPRFPSTDSKPFFSIGKKGEPFADASRVINEFYASDYGFGLTYKLDDAELLRIVIGSDVGKSIKDKIKSIPSVKVVTHNPDINIMSVGADLLVTNTAGDKVRQLDSSNLDNTLLQLIQGRIVLKKVLSQMLKNREKIVDISIQSMNAEAVAFRKHQKVKFKVHSELTGKLLLLDIMGDGQIAVLSPVKFSEFNSPIKAEQVTTGFKSCVFQADEMDSVIALVFKDQPDLIKRFMTTQEVSADGVLMRKLMSILQDGGVSYAAGYAEMYSVDDGKQIGIDSQCFQR
jgi:hypothetical protein